MLPVRVPPLVQFGLTNPPLNEALTDCPDLTSRVKSLSQPLSLKFCLVSVFGVKPAGMKTSGKVTLLLRFTVPIAVMVIFEPGRIMTPTFWESFFSSVDVQPGSGLIEVELPVPAKQEETQLEMQEVKNEESRGVIALDERLPAHPPDDTTVCVTPSTVIEGFPEVKQVFSPLP